MQMHRSCAPGLGHSAPGSSAALVDVDVEQLQLGSGQRRQVGLQCIAHHLQHTRGAKSKSSQPFSQAPTLAVCQYCLPRHTRR